MSVFSLFTAKGGSEADDSPPPDLPILTTGGNNGSDANKTTSEPDKKGRGWFSWISDFSAILSSDKSGGYHEGESVSHFLSVLYYVFLIIVLVFVIDQTCRGDGEASALSRFNPFVS